MPLDPTDSVLLEPPPFEVPELAASETAFARTPTFKRPLPAEIGQPSFERPAISRLAAS